LLKIISWVAALQRNAPRNDAFCANFRHSHAEHGNAQRLAWERVITKTSIFKYERYMSTLFILETLSQTLLHLGILPSTSRIGVAYSGGLDSHVLLHALAQLRERHAAIQLHAIHVNHGLSSYAAAWEAHCQAVCLQLAIPLEIGRIDPQVYGRKANLEEVARDCRYHIFADLLLEGACLLTAHHQDDQAETVLLRLLRGAGPTGVSAMSWKRSLGAGVVARPFLEVSRRDLEAYARDAQLSWVEDESNAVTKMDRNYLRHAVLPLLKTRWPTAAASLSRVAQHAQEATQLLAEMAEADYAQVQGTVSGTLSVSSLQKYSLPRQKNILRFWLQDLGFALPGAKKMQTLLHCLRAKGDAMPCVSWEGVEVRRFRDDLYGMSPVLPHDPRAVIPWDMQAPLLIEHVGWIWASDEKPVREAKRGLIYLASTARVSIGFRRGGEMLHPAGRIGSHPLKKLYQEWAVPPWMRDRIPLLYVEEELAMVVGHAVAEQYAHASSEQKGYWVCLG
jgi:tRNA(Ile)-lysidine synthase